MDYLAEVGDERNLGVRAGGKTDVDGLLEAFRKGNVPHGPAVYDPFLAPDNSAYLYRVPVASSYGPASLAKFMRRRFKA